MDALARHLYEIVEDELSRARRLAGAETWNGPRAIAVQNDLLSIQEILIAAAERGRHRVHPHLGTQESSTSNSHSSGPWGF